jgi:DNA-binding NarL/FixJ family response regulator
MSKADEGQRQRTSRLNHGDMRRLVIRLSEKAVSKLEELRQQAGKPTVAAFIEDAMESCAKLMITGDVLAYQQLTPRLRQVLRMIAEGKSTKEMASELHLSHKTVEYHRYRIMKQLGSASIAGLVRFAIRVGAIAP